MNFWLFLGRFHPLIVHLPIGFLILAILMEFLNLWKGYKHNLKPAIQVSLAVGTASAFVAVILGLMLATEGEYDRTTLVLHKWMGIGVALISLFYFLLRADLLKKVKVPAKAYPILGVIIMIMLSITGHKGGDMTHGNTYLLEYAPNSVKRMAGMEVIEERPPLTTIDSAIFFVDVVQPLLKKRCVSCHNEGKPKGQLILSTIEGIQKGGKHGSTVVANSKEESELYRRITLDPTHEEFMPTDGKTPFTGFEVNLIGNWIDGGADYENYMTAYDLPESHLTKIKDFLGLNEGEAVEEAVADGVTFTESAGMTKLREAGFNVRKLDQTSNLLDVSFIVTKKNLLTAEKVKLLLEEKDNIVWLNLSRTPITDDDLNTVKELNNLEKLRLDNTTISSAGINKLKALQKLKYLNLFGTTVKSNEITLEADSVKVVYPYQNI